MPIITGITDLDQIRKETAASVRVIADAAEAALKPVATAATDAVHAIAMAAADALKVKNVQSESDHTAIITLVANFINLKENQEKFQKEVKENQEKFQKEVARWFVDLKENYSEKINNNKIEIDNQDKRISSLEESRAEVKGKVSITTVIVGYIFTAVGLLLAFYMALRK